MAEAHVQIYLSQVLIKVDDCIYQITLAQWVIALSASLMIVDLLGISDSEISQILSLAGSAYLQIGIPMQFSYLIGGYTTLPMQAIYILTDDELKQVLFQ
jgi:hypothetical protein